jgi:hypothetical protein
MKTLHFDASGKYTGYSVNHTTWSEKLVGVAAGLVLTGASAAVTFIVGNVVMPKAVEKYIEKQQQAKTTESDKFEDPK